MIFVCLVASVVPAVADELYDLRKENRILDAEFALAKKPSIYFVFDLDKSLAQFRARGVTHRELNIVKWSAWGRIPTLKALSLLRKEALVKPTIKTGDSIADRAVKKDAEAQELKDMPVSYDLFFEDNVVMHVRGRMEGFKGRIADLWDSIYWRYSRAIITLVDQYRKNPSSTYIYLSMNPEEAQALYWAFQENFESFIIHDPHR
ncbi:MAG: hypothetical protein HZA20_13740 [Nitrospirae bacterium]|nr:hypothetical protein [Nitrospirota bacterium]